MFEAEEKGEKKDDAEPEHTHQHQDAAGYAGTFAENNVGLAELVQRRRFAVEKMMKVMSEQGENSREE